MAGETSPEELEGVALALYRRAGLEPDTPADPVELAERLLGEGCVRLVHSGALPGTAALARVVGCWRVYVRSRASAERQRFAVLHELGHYALGLSAREADCDAVAAALLLPYPAFRRAAIELGADWSALAARFDCSESAVALRWGEVVGDPLALVAPLTVRVRGLPWGWPQHDHAIRELAAAPRPGLASTRLRDDQRRMVLRAAG